MQGSEDLPGLDGGCAEAVAVDAAACRAASALVAVEEPEGAHWGLEVTASVDC